MEPVRVKIYGRALRRLYDQLHQHRISFVAESTRDFAEDGQPVVAKVEFKELNGTSDEV
jgi:hypothetical protein